MTQAGLIAGAQSLADSLNAIASRRFAGEQGSLERQSMMDRLMAEMKNRESMVLLADQLGRETEKREEVRATGERESQVSAFESMFGAPPVSDYDLTEQPNYAGGPGITGGAPPPGGGAFYEDLSPSVQQFMGGFGELPPDVQPYAAEYMQPFMMEDVERGRTETRLSGITDIMNRMLDPQILLDLGIEGDLGFEELMYLREINPEFFDIQTMRERITDEFQWKNTLASMAGSFSDRGSSNEDTAQFFTEQGLEMTPDMVQQLVEARDNMIAAELEMTGLLGGMGGGGGAAGAGAAGAGVTITQEEIDRYIAVHLDRMGLAAQAEAMNMSIYELARIELIKKRMEGEPAEERPGVAEFEPLRTEARAFGESPYPEAARTGMYGEVVSAPPRPASVEDLLNKFVRPLVSQMGEAEDNSAVDAIYQEGLEIIDLIPDIEEFVKKRMRDELLAGHRANRSD